MAAALVDRARLELDRRIAVPPRLDPPARPSSPLPSPEAGPLNTLTDHYAGYFASERELEWYRIGAVAKARNILDMCSDVPHASVLDIGSGDGAVLLRLDQAGFGERLHAVDISDSGLAALHTKPWTRLVEARRFDGYYIPYPENSFDLAILSHVIEHVEHPRLLLAEAARVARRLFIEVPLESCLGNTRLRGDFELDATGHINFYDPDLFRFLVQSSGLRVLRQETRTTTLEQCRFGARWRGTMKFIIKKTALRLSERRAARRFVYHGAIVCEKSRPPHDDRMNEISRPIPARQKTE